MKKQKIIILSLVTLCLFSSCKKKQNQISSNNPNASSSITTSVSTSSNSKTTSINSLNNSSSSFSSSITIPTVLDTPTLVVNEQGLVRWNVVPFASEYEYIINGKDAQKTSSTSLQLKTNEVVIVRSIALDGKIAPSNWSNPSSYCSNEITSLINIFFYDSNIDQITLNKNTHLSKIPTPTKDGYIFDGWYFDSFFKEPLSEEYLFTKNTILYAKWTPKGYFNAAYFMKASSEIIAENMSEESSKNDWHLIPLIEDESIVDYRAFSTTIEVHGVSSSSPARFVIKDGIDDNSDSTKGRTYWKDGESDFSISSKGTYKVLFSLENEWKSGLNKVHVKVEMISSEVGNIVPSIYDVPILDTLETPLVSIDCINGRAIWRNVKGATKYAYSIDNGEIQYTTSNYTPIRKNNHIVVKAISEDENINSSMWSNPIIYRDEVEENNSSYAYVYFSGCNIPSQIVLKDTITLPDNPTKFGYTFIGWYEDIGLKTPFDRDKIITKNTILYPKWEKNEDSTYALREKGTSQYIAKFSINESNKDYNEYKATIQTHGYKDYEIIDTQSKKIVSTIQNIGGNTYNYYYDIYYSPDHIWNLKTDNELHYYAGRKITTVYFTNAAFWELPNNAPYCYTWDKNKTHYREWPGEMMNFERTNSYGQAIFSYNIPYGVVDYIIFSNNSNKQTVNIPIDSTLKNQAFYTKDTRDDQGHYEYGTYSYN